MAKFEKGELQEIIVKILAATLLVGGSIVFPNLPIALGAVVKLINSIQEHRVTKGQVRRSIRYLESKELLTITVRDKEIYVELLESGYKKLLKYSIKELLEYKRKKKSWNRNWYIVFFDIPEQQRLKRDSLRQLLIFLGFYQYQKSVYIFPFDCRKEVEMIGKIVESSKYMRYIVASEIQGESDLRRHFKI